MRRLPQKFVSIVTTLVLLGIPAISFAQAELTGQEKAQRRLEFNRYAEKQLAVTAAPAKKKIYQITASTSFGHENNTFLNSSRTGDTFHQENIYGKINLRHPGIEGALGAGEYGLTGFTQFKDYSDEDRFDYHNTHLSSFFKTSLFNHWTLDVAYDLNIVRYIHANQLDYLANGFRTKWRYPARARFRHGPQTRFQFKDYRDRKKRSVTAAILDEEREDLYWEVGYGFEHSLTRDLLWGVSSSWKHNDSNDQNNDFNDYEGYRIRGFFTYRFHPKIIWVGFGGYDFREYDDRIFLAGSTETEENEYYYLGTNVFYNFTNSMRLGLTYLYGQNVSNDPAQEYSYSTMTAGLYLNL